MSTIEKVDINSLPEEILLKLLELSSKDKKTHEEIINCFKNNPELFQLFKDYPKEAIEYLDNQFFFLSIIKKPTKTLEIMKRNIMEKIEEEYYKLYFIIIIHQKDFEDIIAYVDKEECKILAKIYLEDKGEKYFQILYQVKIKELTEFSHIQLFSKKYNQYFENEKRIEKANKGILIIFENHNFKTNSEIKPPRTLSFKNMKSEYNAFFSFAKNSNVMESNEKFKEKLFLEGFEQIKKVKNSSYSKYSINFFLEVLSLVFDNIGQFNEVILLFDIKYIEDNYFFENVKPIFQELLQIREQFTDKLQPEISLNLDSLISIGYLLLPNIKSGTEFILKSSYKQTLLNYIIENLNFFNKKIYDKSFIKFLLDNCERNDNNMNNIISKTSTFIDYIKLIYENIELFKNITFEINFEKIVNEEYWEQEDNISKIIEIIKKCKKSVLYNCSMLNKHFIDNISIQKRNELYKLLEENENDPIKKSMIETDFKEVNYNEEIINSIGIILTEYPNRYDNVFDKLRKINLQKLTPKMFLKFKNIFKKFKFYTRTGKYDQNNYDKNFFFLILDKLENIFEFHKILWNLFDSNILYNFSKFESDKLLKNIGNYSLGKKLKI